jgi:TP901 family phage tail tape measure protein
MTMDGNMKTEITKVGGQLTRVKKTMYEWQNGTLRPIQRDITNFSKKTNGMSKALNGAALRFIGIQAAIQLASQAFRKMNEWIDVSVKQFREFENSMAEVSTILTGESYQALVTLTEGVKQLSVQYGQSAVDMSRGLYQILSAAVPVEKALNMLNTATKASIAGLTSVETSVDVLTSIINSYGKSVEQAAGVSDILFQTVVRGKLRFEDLASSLGYITPIAAAAGVAFEEIAAALATVTRMGLHVDMASRGLALTIQNVVSPTKQASEAAKKYGVDMSAVAIRVFGLKGFITDLSAAVKEFGLAVLPTMVRNMRSLRVVMALASE